MLVQLDKGPESSKNSPAPSATTTNALTKPQARKATRKSLGSMRHGYNPPNRQTNSTKDNGVTALTTRGQEAPSLSPNQVQPPPRSFPATVKDSKAFSSPLKIRIPGRLQQKLASTPYATSDHLASPLGSHRPRRSLRRQSSTNGTHSDGSASFEGGSGI